MNDTKKNKNKNRKNIIVLYDVDGPVLPMHSSWWLAHSLFDTLDAGNKNYIQFQKGELTYEEWAQLDVSLWQGRKVEILIAAAQSIEPRSEFLIISKFLRTHKVLIVFISSGIDILIKRIAKRVGVAHCYSNNLRVRNGKITGEIDIQVPLDDKGKTAQKFKKLNNILISIGDSKWDETMFNASDYAIRIFGNKNKQTKHYLELLDANPQRIIDFITQIIKG